MNKYRDEAIQWAQHLVEHSEQVVILDFETTGIGKEAEIIQIGILGFENRRPFPLMKTLVKPSRHIPIPITNLTGISELHTAAAHPFTAYYDALQTILTNKIVVAYNAAFDERLLAQTCNRYKLTPIQATWNCAMKMYAQYHGEWSDRRRSFRWKSLLFACENEGIVVERLHHALIDCELTWRVILTIASQEISSA